MQRILVERLFSPTTYESNCVKEMDKLHVSRANKILYLEFCNKISKVEN